MRLPVINWREGDRVTPSHCQGLAGCATCSLYVDNGGRCSGCTSRKQEVLGPQFKECGRDCARCVGHNLKQQVSAICCHSPLKDSWLTAVCRGDEYNKPNFVYRQRKPLNFTARGIFYVNAGSIATIARPDGYLVPPGTEAVMVSLARIWTGSKFASQDMHDYLRIPKGTKLLLGTLNKDDTLEAAWNKEVYADPHEYIKMGFHAWMPIIFSQYYSDAQMQAYMQMCRTLYTQEKSQSHFSSCGMIYPGLDVDDLFRASVTAAPNVVMNAQFLENATDIKRSILRIQRMHALSPPEATLWVVGHSTPSYIATVKQYAPGRQIYYVSGNPHHFATQGKLLLPDGKGKSMPEIPKNELATRNLAAFEELIRTYG